jgi:PIN domain nuclease of toxin-antitoxin system
MRFLLDTHALLWALAEPRRLPPRVATALRDPANEVVVSAVSTWEITIKAALKKLDADVDEVVKGLRTAGFDELVVTLDHTVRLRDLPAHHRDPFDRLLVAQALVEGLTLVTHDPAFAEYPAPRYWN